MTWLNVWGRSDDEDPMVGGWLLHKDSLGIRIVEHWNHPGMRATCSHEMIFEEVWLPLEHAVSVNRWSAPQPELDASGIVWI